MSRRSTVIALSSAAVSVAGGVATVVLVALNIRSIHGIDGADPIGIVMPLTFAAVGGLIAARHPRNATGWLFLFIGVVVGLQGFADQYARLGLITHPGSVAGATWALWFSTWVGPTVWPVGAAALVLMLVPDGRLPSPRWRVLAVANAVMCVLLVVVFGLLAPNSMTVTATTSPAVQNPTGLPGLPALAWTQGALGVAIYFVAVAIVVVAAAAPFVRLRRARGEARQQLKWIAYAVLLSAILAGVLTVVGAVVQSATWLNTASDLAIVLGFAIALPVATGVAIFKYRLYDIDIVISRTLVYGSLAVLITGVYVGIAVGIGELVGSGGRPNLGLSILATAIVAVGFQPARERLQRVANRLVYGTRATPYQVLSEFSSQVAGSYAADEVLPRMARVLDEGTGAERSTIWLRSGDALHAAAAWPVGGSERLEPAIPLPDGVLPAIPGATRAVEVRHQGELLGVLSVVKRRGESLTPVEDKLLDDLAHQAGLVLKNVGLTADLQRRLEELRASRQRLVSAQDEERRRLERNLHDGAQQHLVALKVKLGLAEMLAVKDPARARATLQQLNSDTDEALETLRDLARGIYPPLLAEKGLPTALESQARKATIPVTVDTTGVGRYPQEVEATVYFCVLEALQNVQKYAEANRAVVRLRDDGRALRFEVEDDGRGFDSRTVRRGAGLTNMNDRIDALSGSLEVNSRPAHGTTVRAVVPVIVATAGAA
ncbi:MAG TPA: histidine kinase [Candidatus Dormibacteraeota bacterium]